MEAQAPLHRGSRDSHGFTKPRGKQERRTSSEAAKTAIDNNEITVSVMVRMGMGGMFYIRMCMLWMEKNSPLSITKVLGNY